MDKKDLLESFTNALITRASTRKELVYQIADILHIEKESAYRRLSGKVHFTVREMGILATEMDISLDSLLNKYTDKNAILFKMDFIPTPATIDVLENLFKNFALIQEQARIKDAEVGTVLNSLPVEFYSFQPHLSKFMYFKWGHNYIGSKEYDIFSTWQIPESLLKAQNRYLEAFYQYKSIFYVWDRPIIWNIINEIKYYKLINVLSAEDVALIKGDLHALLDGLEELLKGNKSMNPYEIEFEFYITNFNVSTTSFYILSNDSYLSSIRVGFLHPVIQHDYETGHNIHQWINSIKKFSSLISGSGEKDRKIFFREQHDIIDGV